MGKGRFYFLPGYTFRMTLLFIFDNQVMRSLDLANDFAIKKDLFKLIVCIVRRMNSFE